MTARPIDLHPRLACGVCRHHTAAVVVRGARTPGACTNRLGFRFGQSTPETAAACSTFDAAVTPNRTAAA